MLAYQVAHRKKKIKNKQKKNFGQKKENWCIWNGDIFMFGAVWEKFELKKLNKGTCLAGQKSIKIDGVLQIILDCDVSYNTTGQHLEAAPLFFTLLSASSL